MNPETALNHEARIAALETEIATLRKIDEKLDNLLEFKHKGMGAFWLGSILFALPIAIGLEWLKGWFFG